MTSTLTFALISPGVALAGVAVGQWLTSAREHRAWRRDRRADAYVDVLVCLEDVVTLWHGAAAEGSQQTRLAALHKLSTATVTLKVYGSEGVSRWAEHAVCVSVNLFGATADLRAHQQACAGFQKAVQAELKGETPLEWLRRARRSAA